MKETQEVGVGVKRGGQSFIVLRGMEESARPGILLCWEKRRDVRLEAL